MTIIQINPCTEDEHGVERCEPAQAMFYGVYIGQPGEYVWAADFADPAHAREFAGLLVAKYGYELEDNSDASFPSN